MYLAGQQVYNYGMSLRRALERIVNRVPPGAVRDNNESFLGIPFHALFGRTLDVWQDNTGNEPVEWWGHVEEIFEFYDQQLRAAGDMVRNQNYDPEIWKAIYNDVSPENVVAKYYGAGGINALKTVHRVRPGEFWRKHEAVLRADEAPVMMLVDGYGSPESRISVGAWQGNAPLVMIADESMQHVLFDTSFVESMGHQPNTKLGFRITPGKKGEVWDDNLSTMSAQDPVAAERLSLVADRDPDYRESQLIEVCELARVAKESPNLFRQICGLATLGRTKGGVGIAATMSPAEAIVWSEKGTKLQKEFLNQARFVVGTVLDADTATHLGKTLAPRVEMNPEDLAEKLLYAGGSQVVFVDDGVVEMGWLIG